MRDIKEIASNKAAELTLGISVLRTAAATFSAPRALLLSASRSSTLSTALLDNFEHKAASFPSVAKHVNSLFYSNPLVDAIALRKPNFLSTAKATLPPETKFSII